MQLLLLCGCASEIQEVKIILNVSVNIQLMRTILNW